VNKKEIYEHLANIYLDASLKSSKKKQRFGFNFKPTQSIFFAGVLMVLGLGSFTAYTHFPHRTTDSQIALFLHQDTAKINFNFDPAKKEIFSLNLKQLDLSKYKTLAFNVKKTHSSDIISLRVEFTNRFNEKSEFYIKDISNKWTDEKINFKNFVKLNGWTQMKELAFSVEEWNAREKSGIVYLDNIRILK
jgi:hypothetical protein